MSGERGGPQGGWLGVCCRYSRGLGLLADFMTRATSVSRKWVVGERVVDFFVLVLPFQRTITSCIISRIPTTIAPCPCCERPCCFVEQNMNNAATCHNNSTGHRSVETLKISVFFLRPRFCTAGLRVEDGIHPLAVRLPKPTDSGVELRGWGQRLELRDAPARRGLREVRSRRVEVR